MRSRLTYLAAPLFSGVPGVTFTAGPAAGVDAPACFIDPAQYVLKGTTILAVSLGGEKGVSIAKTALPRRGQTP